MEVKFDIAMFSVCLSNGIGKMLRMYACYVHAQAVRPHTQVFELLDYHKTFKACSIPTFFKFERNLVN